MRLPSQSSARLRAWHPSTAFAPTLPNSHYGRSAAYRRIHDLRASSLPAQSSTSSFSLRLSSPLLPSSLRSPPSLQSKLPQILASSTRHFHIASSLWQEANKKEQSPSPDQTAADADSPKNTSGDGAETSDLKTETGEQSSESSESESSESKEKKDEGPEAPPPPHGDKTPWQVFTETLSNEFKASKEWNESTKALQSGYEDFTQNPALQKAKSAYEGASKTAASTTGAALKTTGKAIGQSAAWAWDTPVAKVVRKGAIVAGSGLEKATRPVRETDAYKNVKNVIDDGSSSRYGGWTEKEERRRKRAERLAEAAKNGGRPLEPLVEDPEAGTNVTLHKDAAWKESWKEFRESSRLFQSISSLKSTYNESENPLVSTARSWADTIGGFFAENETAMVIKKFREIDPSFQLEPFLQEMREYILPEVLDAYVKGDVATLKEWLSAAQFSVYSALMQQYTTNGLKSDGRILDIRNVEVMNARLLDPGEIPVFIITARTQEVHVYRNLKSGELAAGMDDRVQQVTYAIGVTRIPEDVNNPETRGWRLIELQKSARDYI